MRAIVFDGKLAYRPRQRDPVRPRDEALVEVLVAGICNTDLEIARGYMGFKGVLGHEFVGRVLEGPPRLVGKRVVGEINCGCGRCAGCKRGDPRHCPTRTVLGILGRDGAFADRLTLPARNLTPVPDGVPDEVATFTEPLAAALQVLTQVDPKRDGPAAVVLGDGKLGLLVAQAMLLGGFQVTAVGRHRDKLDLLRRKGIRLRGPGARGRLTADVVVECTGTAVGLGTALEVVRPRGTIVLKSTVADTASLNLAPAVVNEVRILGSRCGRFAPALEALAAERVQVDRMIQAVLPIEQGLEAFERASTPGTLKVLLRVNES